LNIAHYTTLITLFATRVYARSMLLSSPFSFHIGRLYDCCRFLPHMPPLPLHFRHAIYALRFSLLFCFYAFYERPMIHHKRAPATAMFAPLIHFAAAASESCLLCCRLIIDNIEHHYHTGD